MEINPLEDSENEKLTPKTRIDFPTFTKYSITTLVDGKENQPDLTPSATRTQDDVKTNALTIENDLTTPSLFLTQNLICQKSLTATEGVFVKKTISLAPTETININGELNLLNSTIKYETKTRGFDSARVSDRKDQEYVPYGELKKYKISFMSRSAWSKGGTGKYGSIYRGQYFSWNNYQELNFVKYNDSVFEIVGADAKPSSDLYANYYLAFKKPGIYRISVAISKHGAWLDNGRGGINELKVTFKDGYTYKIGHMTTAGQTNYNYRSSGIIGAVISANQPGSFWIESLGPSYRINYFDWSVVRLPSLQWEPFGDITTTPEKKTPSA